MAGAGAVPGAARGPAQRSAGRRAAPVAPAAAAGRLLARAALALGPGRAARAGAPCEGLSNVNRNPKP